MRLRLWNYKISRLYSKVPLVDVTGEHKRSYCTLKMNGTSGKRGALLVFEGLDRSGKSTQSKLLLKSLQNLGKNAELMVFPDRSTPIGKIISEYLSNKSYELNDKALHLLFTANRFENMNKMRKLLLSGVNVVVDRYSYSGIVFSAAKKGIDVDWCKYPESGLPAPDAVFFLKLSFEEMKNRPGFGNERYENLAFQAKVLREYEKLADEYNFININAKDTIENIQNTVVQHSLQTINAVQYTGLQYLDFINRDKALHKKENISINNVSHN